jgi:hypothetical protein
MSNQTNLVKVADIPSTQIQEVAETSTELVGLAAAETEILNLVSASSSAFKRPDNTGT